MYFDYTIVLAFILAGLLFALARGRGRARTQSGQVGGEPPDAAKAGFDAQHLTLALVAIVSTAGIGLLMPLAPVIRDCLHDSGAAQSRGIGTQALAVGGLFLAIVSLGVARAWKQSEPGTLEDSPVADPLAKPKP